ncbi:hypothetical protein BANRA_05449 [Klebsiella pneumoniae]|nr:hypothetical protein BANRA_05449 [Klebsiella pneumoniae]
MVLRGYVSVSNGFTTVMQESSQCLIWYQIILWISTGINMTKIFSKIYSSSGVRLARCKVGMSSQSLLLLREPVFRQTRLERLIAVKTFTRIEKKLWRTPEDKTNVLG